MPETKKRIRRKVGLFPYTPGADPVITNSDYTQSIADMVADEYVATISEDRKKIGRKLFPFYKKDLNIAESKLTDTLEKISAIEKEAKKTMEVIAQEIRGYLGYDASFYRLSDGKMVPVDSDRILKAYRAVHSKFPIKIVEQLIYK